MVEENTPKVQRYDVLVLGSGEGGKYTAWQMASLGKRVALIERQYIGGSCPNIACLPSKNFVNSAKVASLSTKSAAYGLRPEATAVDMTVVRNRKRAMVDSLVEMHRNRFASTGTELVMGSGRFIGPKVISVDLHEGGSRILTADYVVVSTGSSATIDPIPGLAELNPLTHVEALELGVVPERLLILGGGYVSLEFAQIMRRLGSQVVVIERNKRLLPLEDEDISMALTRILTDEGIEIRNSVQIERVEGRSGESVSVFFESEMIEGTHLLVATGRTPNTGGIGLDLAGIALTESGYVKVNEHLETSAPGVFAVGDCAGSPKFTHIAFDDCGVVTSKILGREKTTKGRQVPYCLYTDPELAHIGLKEQEAKRQNIPYRLFKLPMEAVLRNRTTGETSGFFKALVAVDSDKILGFTALGAYAGEMLAPVQVVMGAGLPFTVLKDSIFTHPTYSEGLVYLFGSKPSLVELENEGSK